MRRCLLAALLGSALAAWGGDAAEDPAPPPDAPLQWRFAGEVTAAPSVLDEDPRVYDGWRTGFRYRYAFLEVLADMSLLNDQKYTPYERYALGRYFYLNNGGLHLDFDFLSLRAGRLEHRDAVDSPYSLFISSQALPAVLADFTFQGGAFSYQSRWIRLNARSSFYAFPDRGANYKVFALQLGDFRFGFQDSAVYVDRVFDEEYFLSPLPSIFTQMFTKEDYNPWGEESNDNSLMGLFGEWRRPGLYVYAQWLVDDINLDFLVPEFLRDDFGETRIPSKMAWSVGGRCQFPFGRLGFYHAGALKYTFEPLFATIPYSYTYYPATQYQLEDGTVLPLLAEDNYLGYLHGENNLAFRLEFDRLLGPVDFGSSLEYVVSGSKSPANPWHEYANLTEAGRETRLLDDPVLEHVVRAAVSAAWPWRNWTFYARLMLGGAFNRLALEPAVDGGAQIFRPQAGEHVLLYECTLGVSYLWRIGRRQSSSTAAPSVSSSQEPESRPKYR